MLSKPCQAEKIPLGRENLMDNRGEFYGTPLYRRMEEEYILRGVNGVQRNFFAAAARKDLMRRSIQRNFAGITALVLTCCLHVSQVCGAELKVVTSGAFTAAYLELAPEYE